MNRVQDQQKVFFIQRNKDGTWSPELKRDEKNQDGAWINLVIITYFIGLNWFQSCNPHELCHLTAPNTLNWKKIAKDSLISRYTRNMTVRSLRGGLRRENLKWLKFSVTMRSERWCMAWFPLHKTYRFFRFFISTEGGSNERHVYSVTLDGSKKTKLSNFKVTEKSVPPLVQLVNGKLESDKKATVAGFYSASFSPKCDFYSLGYQGPGVPWSKIFKTDDPSLFLVLTGLELK